MQVLDFSTPTPISPICRTPLFPTSQYVILLGSHVQPPVRLRRPCRARDGGPLEVTVSHSPISPDASPSVRLPLCLHITACTFSEGKPVTLTHSSHTCHTFPIFAQHVCPHVTAVISPACLPLLLSLALSLLLSLLLSLSCSTAGEVVWRAPSSVEPSVEVEVRQTYKNQTYQKKLPQRERTARSPFFPVCHTASFPCVTSHLSHVSHAIFWHISPDSFFGGAEPQRRMAHATIRASRGQREHTIDRIDRWQRCGCR